MTLRSKGLNTGCRYQFIDIVKQLQQFLKHIMKQMHDLNTRFHFVKGLFIANACKSDLFLIGIR